MEIDFLKQIVKEAEKISQRDYTVHTKGSGSDLVTNLDLEIEKFLIEQIKKNYPSYDIVSEELNTDGKVTDNCFIIDPIDGTVNFANGLPIWGIQIACRSDGETVASVIDLPKLGEFYYADTSGAYLNGEKISPHEVPIKNAIYSIIGHDSLADETMDWPEYTRMRRYSSNSRNFGAACATFAYVACGRIHGVNFRVKHPWDYEPGLFLCKMAGAKTINEQGCHAAAMNQKFLDILRKETTLQ